MLSPRVLKVLISEHLKRSADSPTRLARENDIVNKPAVTRDKWICELLPILFGSLRNPCLITDVLAEDDFDRAFWAHHGNLCRGPRQINVSAQMLRGHHIIGPAVGLARDDRDLGHGAFGIRIQQLSAVTDDAPVFLCCSGQKAGNIYEGHNRNGKRVAESYEPRGFCR